jgi:hypothetical protein
MSERLLLVQAGRIMAKGPLVVRQMANMSISGGHQCPSLLVAIGKRRAANKQEVELDATATTTDSRTCSVLVLLAIPTTIYIQPQPVGSSSGQELLRLQHQESAARTDSASTPSPRLAAEVDLGFVPFAVNAVFDASLRLGGP